MMSMSGRPDTDLDDFVRDVLGEYSVRADLSQPHGLARVLEVDDRSGRRCVVKQHQRRADWVREVRAYREWAPAIAPHAPQLLGVSRPCSALVLSAARGRPGPADAAAHRVAGVLLRRLHDAVPRTYEANFGLRRAEQMDRWAREGRELLTDSEHRFISAVVPDWLDVSGPLVACHFDYTPRNWLQDPGGDTLTVIDFAGARRHLWTQDLVRLHLGLWRDKPSLREALLDGYGRRLDDADEVDLRRCAITTAGRMLVGSRRRGWDHHAAVWTDHLQTLMATG